VAGVTSDHRSGLAAVAQCRTAIRDAGGSLHVIPSTTNLTWAITSAGLPEPSDPNSREAKPGRDRARAPGSVGAPGAIHC
jgi:hypothetical protein